MSIILSIFAGLIIVALLQIIQPGSKSRAKDICDDYDPENEKEKGGGGYILDLYGMPERIEGDGVLKALLSAFRDLEKQRAAGFRNWIPACIEQAQRGYEIPPEVALTALRMTRDELTGSRFNLDGLNEAIVSLETQMGEWE